MTKHIRGALAALSMTLTGAGCVINLDGDAALVREEKRYTVGPGADLTLETFDGSVKVQSWDRPEVLVAIEKRGPDGSKSAPASRRGGTTSWASGTSRAHRSASSCPCRAPSS